MKDPLAALLNLTRIKNDNLHLIAISNLKDGECQIRRGWERKYRIPEKSFDDHTDEELVIKQLEDYYERYPQEAERRLADAGRPTKDWGGEMDSEYEATIQKQLKGFFKRNKVDLSKYRTEKELDEDEEKKMLEGLGRRLPRSTFAKDLEDEFEDDFGE